MSKKYDAIVIGAGVIGISIAWFLAERGVSVAVYDKGRVAGGVHPQREIRRASQLNRVIRR